MIKGLGYKVYPNVTVTDKLMPDKQHNQPAFPQDLQGRRGDDPHLQGMTLRDYFAAQAIPNVAEMTIREAAKSRRQPPKDETLNTIAILCYNIADAMLEQKNNHES